jgi:hypothetical protein
VIRIVAHIAATPADIAERFVKAFAQAAQQNWRPGRSA